MIPQNPNMLRLRLGVLALVAAVAFSGCASTSLSKYPSPQAPATVRVGTKKMSKMSELPVGAYYDEERQIIVAGHQKGLFTGILLGPIGVLAADSANRSVAREKFGDAASQGSDLGSVLQTLLDQAQAGSRAPHWSSSSASDRLELTPYALFTVQKSGDARLHAMIRAELLGADGKPTWTGRYFAPAPGAYPLAEDGWMAHGRFEEAIRSAFILALDACANDTSGKLVEKGRVAGKAVLPFMRSSFDIRGTLVQEQPDFVVIKFPGSAGVTHVISRADFNYRSLAN